MLTVETEKLEISNNLIKKVDMICKFACVKPAYKNGNIKNIKNTNIAYVMQHIITINNNDYLIFEKCDYIFVSFLLFLTKIPFFVKISDN